MDDLAAAIPRRHTNRRPFDRVVIPATILQELADAAAVEAATLSTAHAIARTAILSLVRTAEQRLRAQGRYRAELTDWTLPARGRRDGIPPQAFGPWAALETMPLRDFGLTQPQLHRRYERFEPYPTILVLSTNGDTADQWVRAGQALQRVLLFATIHGLAATPMSQPLEIPTLRELITNIDTGQWQGRLADPRFTAQNQYAATSFACTGYQSVDHGQLGVPAEEDARWLSRNDDC